MKNNILFLLLGLTITMTACNENESSESGDIQFLVGQAVTENARTQSNAHHVLVSIKRADGSIAYNREKLTLYKFGTEFISSPISLLTGNYQLTEFLILDENNEIIYAAPLEGSALAYLVHTTLPFDFVISNDETIKITPEVLAVENHTPADFGYTTFSFDIIPTFNFSIAAFTYSQQTENFELTEATITILADDTLSFSKTLGAVTNHIKIRDGFSNYKIDVTKSGFKKYSKTFTNDELKLFTGENILKVILLSDSLTNHAMLFDGDFDFIDVGNIYDDAQLPLTISAWARIEEGQKFFPIFISQDTDDGYNGFSFNITYTHVTIGYGDGRGENNSAFRRDKSAPHYGNIFGRWVHLAAVIRSATDMDVYIDGINTNGIYTGESTYPMASNYPQSPARIGSWYSNGEIWHYKGMIDELNIWNKSLSPSEISVLRSKKLIGNETGLIGYWNFDEDSGNIVYDKSSNEFHGTMHGNTARVPADVPFIP